MSFGHIRPLTRGALLALTFLLSAQGCIFTQEELPPSQPNNKENNQSTCTGNDQCRDPQTNACQSTPARSCRDDEGICKVLGTNEDCSFCGDRCGLMQECVSIDGQSQCLDVEIEPGTCLFDINNPAGSDSSCEDGQVCQRGPNGDVCVPPCRVDGECGPTRRCDVLPNQPPQSPTRCVERCQSNDECATGERCDVSGRCILDTPPGCDQGCAPGSVCVEFMGSDRCAPECSEQTPCAENEVCTRLDDVQVCLTSVDARCLADDCMIKAPNTEPLPWDNGRQGGSALCRDNACVVTCEAGFERFGGSPVTGAGYACWSSRNIISAGPVHTCVSLFDSGGANSAPIHHAYCWGEDRAPQAANQDTMTHRITQADLVEVAAGTRHTCALDKSNIVRCFGDNSVRQLGIDANTVPTNGIATPMIGNTELRGVEISAGNDFTCLLSPVGEVACWGLNNNNQLGHDQGRAIKNVLSGTAPLQGIESVRASALYACAVNSLGQLYCWGQYPGKPQASMLGAQLVMTPSPVKQLALGGQHICYINPDAEVLCMGANGKGQLGSASPPGRDRFEQVDLNVNGKAISLSAGADHSCAVVHDTAMGVQLVCWGANDMRQSVPVSRATTAPPTVLEVLGKSSSCPIQRVMMGLGRAHSCALIVAQCNDGIIPVDQQTVRCWGANERGQSGPERTTNPIIAPETVKALCSNGATGVGDCLPNF